MRSGALLLLLMVLLSAGCGTSSIETRRQERRWLFDSLSVEERRLVEEGRLEVGMDTNTVYIAWGPPSQVTRSESPAGRVVHWIYQGTWTEKIPHWTYIPNRYGWGTIDYHVLPNPRRYVRARVEFHNDRAARWEIFPKPRD